MIFSEMRGVKLVHVDNADFALKPFNVADSVRAELKETLWDLRIEIT